MPKWTISKRFEFSASHQLTHLAESRPDHPCARLHGHNYEVIVYLTGEHLNNDAFILDYNALKWFKEYLDDHYDHRHLNNVMRAYFGLNNDVAGQFVAARYTTAENLANIFANTIQDWLETNFEGVQLAAVEVKETPKTCARYEPKP